MPKPNGFNPQLCSILVGSLIGAILFPVLFVSWIGMGSGAGGVYTEGSDEQRRQWSLEDLLLMASGFVWAAAVLLCYSSWGIPGAIVASLSTGGLGGAFLGYRFHQSSEEP